MIKIRIRISDSSYAPAFLGRVEELPSQAKAGKWESEPSIPLRFPYEPPKK